MSSKIHLIFYLKREEAQAAKNNSVMSAREVNQQV